MIKLKKVKSKKLLFSERLISRGPKMTESEPKMTLNRKYIYFAFFSAEVKNMQG